jgi:hypothetical protein
MLYKVIPHKSNAFSVLSNPPHSEIPKPTFQNPHSEIHFPHSEISKWNFQKLISLKLPKSIIPNLQNFEFTIQYRYFARFFKFLDNGRMNNKW